MKNFSYKPIVTACAIALMTGGAPVMAGEKADNASDEWAKASLTTTYTLNQHLNPFDIDTEVQNGVATLRGTVESEVERDLAEELAMGIDGIREVKNELTVSPDAERKNVAYDPDDKNADRGFMRKVEDANLTAQVKSQLLWNSSTEGMAINVDTHNGIVTLSGNVNTKAESELAEQIARNTDEVRGVENKLNIAGKAPDTSDKIARETNQAEQSISDGWITTKVKSALIYNRNVDGSDINVETENGVVTLHGETASDFEREQAVAIARSVKGVKSVKSELSGI